VAEAQFSRQQAQREKLVFRLGKGPVEPVVNGQGFNDLTSQNGDVIWCNVV